MAPTALVARDVTVVKTQLLDQMSSSIDSLVAMVVEGASPRLLELQLWAEALPFLQSVLALLWALVAARETDLDLAQRGLTKVAVRLRTERDYWQTAESTFGPVRFPLFAYRETRPNGGTVTRTPARRGAFRLHQHCKSSELCLEWENRLGCQLPFRQAQRMLRFFTHDAVSLEDNTIASHMLVVGAIIDREWQYREISEIREILRTRATRTTATDLPIVYFSTDAHALRRYVDETWDAKWKMVNGIRVWCQDRRTGQIIHLGGEFTWGDCEVVEAVFKELATTGYLPANGDYGDGVIAQLVFVSDGARWFVERILPIFPGATAILDAYHLLERLAAHAALLFGVPRRKTTSGATAAKATRKGRKVDKKKAKLMARKRKAARTWYTEAIRFILPGHHKLKTPKVRRKRPGQESDPARTPAWPIPRPPLPTSDGPDDLIRFLIKAEIPKKHEEAHMDVITFVVRNLDRIDYPLYRHLGLQIGSGAMESLHRVGSQMRLKIAGASWLPKTAEAIFRLRMMDLVGRWDEFWSRPDLSGKLCQAFESAAEARKAAA